MAQYQNLGGDSGIVAYEIGAESIQVEFSDGSQYLYTYASTGANDIEKMKSLAQAGEGLNEFINKHVRKRYAQKLR